MNFSCECHHEKFMSCNKFRPVITTLHFNKISHRICSVIFKNIKGDHFLTILISFEHLHYYIRQIFHSKRNFYRNGIRENCKYIYAEIFFDNSIWFNVWPRAIKWYSQGKSSISYSRLDKEILNQILLKVVNFYVLKTICKVISVSNSWIIIPSLVLNMMISVAINLYLHFHSAVQQILLFKNENQTLWFTRGFDFAYFSAFDCF